MKLIETERLKLRPYHSEDFEILRALFSDSQVTEHLYLGRPLTNDETATFVSHYLAPFTESDMFGFGILCLRESNLPIGTAGIAPCSHLEDKDVEIGFAVFQQFQRKGYGAEVALRLKEYYLLCNSSERLVALVHPENFASKTIITQTLGMVEATRMQTPDRGPRSVYLLPESK